MKKQTAVEWLHDTWGNYPDLWSWEKIQEWFEQAKAMEKEQIIKAVLDGYRSHPYMAEQYYNETYGGDK
jgi:hypothetical protein